MSLKRTNTNMRLCTLVLAVPILLSLKVLAKWAPDSEGHCTTSESCAGDGRCVDNYCLSSAFDPMKTMRSNERCQALQCAEDEGCYFPQKYDASSGKVTSTLQCGKRNPCSKRNICGRQKCQVIECGGQPPVKLCTPWYHQSPCWNKGCSEDLRCFTRAMLCKNDTTVITIKDEGVCIPLGDCDYCGGVHQRCEARKTDTGYEGFCVEVKRR